MEFKNRKIKNKFRYNVIWKNIKNLKNFNNFWYNVIGKKWIFRNFYRLFPHKLEMVSTRFCIKNEIKNRKIKIIIYTMLWN